MLMLLCSALCLFLSLGFGTVVFLVTFPLLFIQFPTIAMAAFDFLMCLGRFYWDIFVFLFRMFFDLGSAVLHIFINALPIIIEGGTHLYHTLGDIWTGLRYQYFPQFLDFFNHQRDVLLLFWGFVVASVYTLYNQLRPVANEMQLNLQRDNYRNIRDRLHYGDGRDAIDDDADVIDGRTVDDVAARRRRLDRDFEHTDIHTNDAFNDESCVVCFERDRNAAVFPCGHTQTCLTCTRNIMGINRKCPICQRRIDEYRQVFL